MSIDKRTDEYRDNGTFRNLSLSMLPKRRRRMRRPLYFLVLALIAVGIAGADANVTGKWTGTFNSIGPDGETRESTTVMMLKQSGSEITGTFGPNESEQAMVVKGKIGGDKITLMAEAEGRTV